MSLCPNCGSYVSPGTNVCSYGTTFGRSMSEGEDLPEEEVRDTPLRKAKRLMGEGKYLEVIEYIDGLETSRSGSYVMIKAEACYCAEMYSDALPLFRQALEHYSGIDAYPIFERIGDALIGLGRFDEAVDSYRKATDVINEDYERSVEFFKGERWMGYERIEHACASALNDRNERLSEINGRIIWAKELKGKAVSCESGLEPSEDLLKAIGRENLITITGTYFCGNP